MSLCHTISYPWNMSAYNIFLSVSYPSVYTLNSITSLFDSILTTFPTCYLVECSPICRIYVCFHPMITLRYFSNRAPCRDFVRKFANIWYVMHYAIDILLLSTRTLAKKERISMLLEFSVHIFFPCLIFIALWLSWKNMFCLISYICAPMNKKSRCCMLGNHSRQLLRPQWTFLCSVSACWTWNVPHHIQMKLRQRCGYLGQGGINMRHGPMCITELWCMSPWSSYHWLFVFIYDNTHLNLDLLSLVILFTLVHRNNISG